MDRAALAFRAGVFALAGGASLLFLHWLAVLPRPVELGRHEVAMLVTILFRQEVPWAGYVHVIRAALALIAVTGLAASALAITIAVRVPDHIAARRLAWGLSLAAASSAYFFFASTHDVYREAIGWRSDSWMRLALDALAYVGGFLAPLFVGRFFIGYPRSATAQEWLDYLQGENARIRERVRSGWRRRLYPAALRSRMARAAPEGSPLDMAARRFSSVRMAQSRAAPWVLVALASLAAGADFIVADIAPPPRSPLGMLQMVGLLGFVLGFWVFDAVALSLKFHFARVMPEDRAKIEWIKATLVAGGMIVIAVHLATTVAGPFVMTALSDREVFVPVQVWMLWPFAFACNALAFAFVASLAISMFYRGAIDPRLAARRITVFGIVGLVMAFLFILLERTVAMHIVQAFGLRPDTGALIAGAAVAATFAPLRNRAEKMAGVVVARYVPLQSLVGGERRVLAVAMSDLTGYTALSSRDEAQAMLLAALLQRQARSLAEEHGGRLVKTMGDAVMLAFPEPAGAVSALRALHARFAPAATALGLTPLEVHSGAHHGDVTETADGDLYGQTVNLAARLQGEAAPGQLVVSEAMARAASLPMEHLRRLGPRRLKNVPEPVECVALES